MADKDIVVLQNNGTSWTEQVIAPVAQQVLVFDASKNVTATSTGAPDLVVTSSSGTATINWGVPNKVQYITLTESVVFSFSGDTNGDAVNVFVINPSTYTVTWPTARWPNAGTQPVQSTTATDWWVFAKVNGVIYGARNQGYSNS